MIITQTPFRMSFFGGGTDFPDFYNEFGGSVISSTFNKYCYVTVRNLPPFFEYKNELVYSKIERTVDVEEIVHPLIREAMKWKALHDMRITYEGDLPARTGLGTSSSFAVGLLLAFESLKGKYIDKDCLANDAIFLERTLCGESGGVQDQIAASFGGLNRIEFSQDGFHVNPIIISGKRKAELNHNLMLFFTGFSRFSSDIQKVHQSKLRDKQKQLLEILSLVDEAESILTGKGNLQEFGKLLDESWKLKRGINKLVSSDPIDCIYQKALSSGAVGGKLLGAGGGGFLLFYVEPENQERVRLALKDLKEIPFKFEDVGTRVLYFVPEF
jgi:D-glycero-alpha-D-manno-heptose-7-phosphate kinase